MGPSLEFAMIIALSLVCGLLLSLALTAKKRLFLMAAGLLFASTAFLTLPLIAWNETATTWLEVIGIGVLGISMLVSHILLQRRWRQSGARKDWFAEGLLRG